ncbi:MAG: sugar phosphate isomerase/epimerase family protein [Dehalococcoidia bacterium]
MPHKLSLAFLTMFDCGPLEIIDAAGAAGFDMVGLRLLPAAPTEAPYPLFNDPAVLRDTISALRSSNVTVADVEIARLKPDTNVADFERFLDCSAQLGARHVLVAGDDRDAARLTDRFAALCRLCARFGLTADLEFMPWTGVRNLSEGRKIVEDAGEPNGGVLIDALHFDRSQSTLEEIRDLPRSLVNYVQLCDGPLDYGKSDEEQILVARSARLMPGDGGIDCVGLAKSLPEDVTISVEVPNHEMAKIVEPAERARLAYAAARKVLAAAARP